MGTPPRATARRPMSSSARVGRSSGFGDGARAAASARARAAASARETRFDHPPSSRFGGGPVTPIAERARRPATARAPSSVSRHRRGVHDRAPRAARTPARTPAPRATPRSPSVERLAGEYRSLGALAASVASTPRARPTTPSQRGPRYDLNGRRVDADADRGVSAPTRRRDPSPAIRSLREPSATPRARDDARGRWTRPSTAAVEYDLNGRRVVDKSGKRASSAATTRDRNRNRPATAAAAAAVATTTARRPASSSARRTRAPVPLNERPAFDAGPGGLGVDNRDPGGNVRASRRPATSTVSSPPVVDRDRVRARTSKRKSKVPVAARPKPSKTTTADRDRGRRRADADRRAREREREEDDDDDEDEDNEDDRAATSTSEAAFAAARETRRARVRTPSTSGRLSGVWVVSRGAVGTRRGTPRTARRSANSDAARPSAEFTAGYHRAHPPSAPASPATNATARRPRTASAAFDPERAAERFLEEHHGVHANGAVGGGGGGAGVEVGFDPRFDARPGTSAGADAVAAALSRAAALASAPSPSRLAAAYGSYQERSRGVPSRGGARSALRPRDARADRVRADELPALRRRQSRAKWPRARVLFGGARLRRLASRRARDGVSARATARAPTTVSAATHAPVPVSVARVPTLPPAPVPALPTAATVPVSPAASSRCVRHPRGDGESGRVRRLRVPTRDACERRRRRGGGVPSDGRRRPAPPPPISPRERRRPRAKTSDSNVRHFLIPSEDSQTLVRARVHFLTSHRKRRACVCADDARVVKSNNDNMGIDVRYQRRFGSRRLHDHLASLRFVVSRKTSSSLLRRKAGPRYRSTPERARARPFPSRPPTPPPPARCDTARTCP